MGTLADSLSSLAEIRVVVIGDAMVDEYLYGESSRLAREAPVPIVEESNTLFYPGGAANVAANVAALGSQVDLVAITGLDRGSRVLKHILMKRGVGVDYIVGQKTRETLVKRRIYANDQLVLRLDRGTTTELDASGEAVVLKSLEKLAVDQPLFLISDYGYGLCTDRIIDYIASLKKEYELEVVVDSKRCSRYRHLRPALVKPNYLEAVELLGLRPLDRTPARLHQLQKAKNLLLDLTGAKVVAVTLDRDGALIFSSKSTLHVPAMGSVPTHHTVGAGDTYIAAFTVALGAGLDLPSTAEFAVTACNVVVKDKGTEASSFQDVLSDYEYQGKLVDSRQELRNLIKKYRGQGKRIVFTNGCFDILHPGHVSYLRQAKRLGDVLIVGVNSDASVRRLKGFDRPVNRLRQRLQVLVGLESVDHVISFSEDSPVELIRAVRPDIFVKGGDYTEKSLPEASVVRRLGGKVRILPFVTGFSTTQIIDRITRLKTQYI